MNRDNINFSDIAMLRNAAAKTISAVTPSVSAFNPLIRENKSPEAFFFEQNRRMVKRARMIITMLRGL